MGPSAAWFCEGQIRLHRNWNRNVAVSGLRRRQTSYCHGYVPSSASVPSPRARRPVCVEHSTPRTSVLPLIPDTENNFSVWRLMSVDDVSDYVMHLMFYHSNRRSMNFTVITMMLFGLAGCFRECTT